MEPTCCTGRAPVLVLLLAWAAFVAAVYCPDIGRGFVKDDFTWIRAAQSSLAQPREAIAPSQVGFYRPLVTATFMTDFALHGWQPRWYGWTNVALYVACAAAVMLLAGSLGLSLPAAAAAAFIWAVNPHGINMAVVWISGRTALLLTLFAVAAAIAFLRRRYIIAALAILCALASKEEAVVLPFVLLAWEWQAGRRVSRAPLAAALLPLAMYGVLRSLTPAFTPSTAPSFYQFTFAPGHVLRNVAEYLDRSATLAAAVLLIGACVARALPSLNERTRRTLAMCAIWWGGMFALTMWLPVRSSLYAVCPSVASAIAGGLLLDRLSVSRGAPTWRVEYVFAAMLVASIPIYQMRNDPWVEGARVSQRTLAVIRRDAPQLRPTGTIVLCDEAGTVSTFHNAFGDLATEALRTAVGSQWDAKITTGTDAEPAAATAIYRLVHGRIVRDDRNAPGP